MAQEEKSLEYITWEMVELCEPKLCCGLLLVEWLTERRYQCHPWSHASTKANISFFTPSVTSPAKELELSSAT